MFLISDKVNLSSCAFLINRSCSTTAAEYILKPPLVRCENDLSTHDTEIKADLSTHDTDIKDKIDAHDSKMEGLVGGVQNTLDNEIEKQRVHIDVVEVLNRQRYLISTTEAGQPVEVQFLSILVAKKSNMNFSNVLANSQVSNVGAATSCGEPPRPAGGAQPSGAASASRTKVTKAMPGRFEASRMANWMPSRVQPWAVHSLRIDSSASSVTVLVSTTL